MGEGSASRLFFAGILGFFFLLIGLTGRLGSLLAAVIDPAGLSASSSGVGGLETPEPGRYSGGALTASQIATLAGNAGFVGANLTIAVAVCFGESGGKPGEIANESDGSKSYGLWQINSSHTQFDKSKLLNPVYNAQCAYTVFLLQGWRAWGAYTNGSYLKFLGIAQEATGNA